MTGGKGEVNDLPRIRFCVREIECCPGRQTKFEIRISKYETNSNIEIINNGQ
jgi:hypothetical protein